MSNSRNSSDYSFNFLKPKVWTNPYNVTVSNGTDPGVVEVYKKISPLYQVNLTNNPAIVSFRFAKEVDKFCTVKFGPNLQEMTHGILNEISDMVPVKFTQNPDDQPSDITFVMCDYLLATGVTYTYDNGEVEIDLNNRRGIVPLETVLKYSKQLNINLLHDGIRNLLTHEIGHAMGLKHTHTYGEQGNPDLIEGFTDRSSIMSYDAWYSTVRGAQDMVAWSKVPKIRVKYGPVDKINLQYAYDIKKPSIRKNQTDDTFPPLEKISPSVLPTYLLSFWPQVAGGVGLAIVTVAAPKLEGWAEGKGYSNVASVAGGVKKLIVTFSPIPPEKTDGSWKEAGKQGAKDIAVGLGRMIVPLAGVTYDITYNIGSNLAEKGVLYAAKTAVTDTLAFSTMFVLNRGIGRIPVMGAYALAKEAASGPAVPEGGTRWQKAFRLVKMAAVMTFKVGANMVVGTVANARGFRYVLPTRFSRWWNGAPVDSGVPDQEPHNPPVVELHGGGGDQIVAGDGPRKRKPSLSDFELEAIVCGPHDGLDRLNMPSNVVCYVAGLNPNQQTEIETKVVLNSQNSQKLGLVGKTPNASNTMSGPS